MNASEGIYLVVFIETILSFDKTATYNDEQFTIYQIGL